jgi:asparagine synthase (glutamine-hydrolysing)
VCGFCLSVGDASVDIHRLTESIKHRGPDSTKYFIGSRVVCGFNRLSIVDRDDRSDQPMLDSSEHYLLAFNGEIYNHRKLRTDLENRCNVRFKTRSDTEVLLNGLIYEGIKFIAKLDGIFAFAFVDLHSLDVLLVRDIFGVKPLYYYTQGSRLYVSSELKPLWQQSGSKIHFSNIARYLSYGTVGNGEAIISGINELEPNTIKRFVAGKNTLTSKVHNFEYDVDEKMDLDEITDVVDRTIDSQKPEIAYGVLYSGGLDSTLILDRSVKDDNFYGAYSVDVDHPDMSEVRWQDYAASILGVPDKHRKIKLSKEDLSVENIAKVASELDHPLFHPNFIASFLLTRRAAEDGLKVLISGEGADELFLGYRWFFAKQDPSEFLEYIPLKDVYAAWGTDDIAPVQTSGMSVLEIFQKIYLQRWLMRQDLTGMANSVEVRVPFLGFDLAVLANKLSMRFKRGRGNGKWIIKKMLSDKFSKEFVERKKIGFDFPLNDWIGAEHVSFLQQRTDLFDLAGLNATFAKYHGSFMKNRIVFSLVSFAAWHDSVNSHAGRKIFN